MVKKAVNVYIALILSVYLLAVPPGGYEVISGFKLALYAVMTAPLIILTAASTVKGLKPVTAMQAAVMLFLIFSIISAALSEFGAVTLLGAHRYEGLASCLLYTLMFLCLSVNLKPARWQVYVFAAAVSLMCVVIFLQYKGLNPLGLFPRGLSYLDSDVLYSGKYAGTTGNAGLTASLLSAAAALFAFAVIRLGGQFRLLLIPALLSAFILGRLGISAGNLALAAALVIAIPVMASDRQRLVRLLTVYPLILAAWGFDRLRAPAWCLIILTLIAALLLYKFKPEIKRIRLYMLLALIVICLLALTYVWLYKGQQYGAIYEANRLMHGVWDDSYGNGRLFIWRRVWELVKERPLFGGGPDTLGLRGLPPYVWYSDTAEVHTYITAAHNEYLNVLVNQGLFAAVCYLALPVITAVNLYRSKRESVIIASGAALCYAVGAFFSISMCASATFYWLLLSYADNNNQSGDKLEGIK